MQTQGTHTDAQGRAHGHGSRDTIRNTNARARTRHADPKAICKTRIMQRMARHGTATAADTGHETAIHSTRLAARSWSTAARGIRFVQARIRYAHDHGADPYDTYDTHGSAQDHSTGTRLQRWSAVSRAQPQHTARGSRAGQYAGNQHARYASRHVTITLSLRTARQAAQRSTALHAAATGTQYTSRAAAKGRSLYDSHGKRQNVSGLREKRLGGGRNQTRFPFGGIVENQWCNRQLIYI
jgi:hypothetical protein